jgi:hypothetical protein
VARQVGSTGALNLGGNSVINAGFVGVGVSAAGTGDAIGAAGGTGTLVLNNSTINTSRFELGAGSSLTGDGGVINVADTVNPVSGLPEKGPVVIAGTINPGNSPGRIRINRDTTTLMGSRLILEIDQNGASFDIDQLIIGNDSNFDLTQLQIIFGFIGDTNPNDYAINLDNFLRAGTTNDGGTSDTTTGLSALFGKNGNAAGWGTAVNSQLLEFRSSVYDFGDASFNPETGQIEVAAAPIPEPASIALALLALLAMAGLPRRRAMRCLQVTSRSAS